MRYAKEISVQCASLCGLIEGDTGRGTRPSRSKSNYCKSAHDSSECIQVIFRLRGSSACCMHGTLHEQSYVTNT